MKIDFIQIGANVGNTNNDPLYKKIVNENWKGVLVEPNPKAFKQLQKNYQNIEGLYFCEAAITDKNDDIALYVDNYHIDNNGKGEGTSQHGSCLYSVITDRLKHKKEELSVVLCKGITLDSLATLFNIESVKHLYIDTEGFDAKIILSIDFSKFDFEYIQYEHAHISKEDFRLTIDHLSSFGYNEYKIIGEDVIYERKT